MRKFKSVEEVLEFAISKEEEAAEFYTDMASIIDGEALKEMFLEMAKQEKQHKAKLENLDINNIKTSEPEKVLNLKIAEYITDVKPAEKVTFEEALVIAMKNEKASFVIYSTLSKVVQDKKMKDLFLFLAQEEAHHKLYFELQYDQHFLK